MNSSDRVPSFPEIYDTYFGLVRATSRHHGVRPSEVDDVMQDVFFRVYRNFQTMERPESMRSWMYSIVRRTVQQYHRKRLNRPSDKNTDWLDPDSHAHVSSLVADPAQLQRVESVRCLHLLTTLDTEKREVLVLADLEDFTAPEISEKLQVPLNTVYSRLRAARSELRVAWRRYQQRMPLAASRPEAPPLRDAIG